jgi:hypothetical protein
MDLTQINKPDSHESEGSDISPESQNRSGNRAVAYICVLTASLYILASVFFPLLRVWEKIPGLKTTENEISAFENLSRAGEIFNPSPPESLRLPATDLTDFVFSPDGNYIIMLFNDLEKSRSLIQIKEVGRGESKNWKVWREFGYEFHILKIGAFRDRIAFFMQESATAASSISNMPLTENTGEYSLPDYSERTFFAVIDYNGQNRAQEVLPGKYLQSAFSGDLSFVQTSRNTFMLRTVEESVFRINLGQKSGVRECRPAENSYLCLSISGLGLTFLKVENSSVEISPALLANQRILFWDMYEGRIVYYTSDNYLTIRHKDGETVFPKKFNSVHLIAGKSFQGKKYLAIFADSRLILSTLGADGGFVILYDRPVEYPLSALAFHPGADRFLLAANQAGADYMHGNLQIFVFNLNAGPETEAVPPI